MCCVPIVQVLSFPSGSRQLNAEWLGLIGKLVNDDRGAYSRVSMNIREVCQLKLAYFCKQEPFAEGFMVINQLKVQYFPFINLAENN